MGDGGGAQAGAGLPEFEALAALDDGSVQRLLRGSERGDVAAALAGASAGLRERFLRNVSARAAAELASDFAGAGVAGAVTQEAQRRLVATAADLRAAGEIPEWR